MKIQPHYIATAVISVAVGVAAFFGGMQYQLHQTPARQNGQFGGRFAGAGAGRQGNTTGMRPVVGEVIAQDDTSITVKMPDGSTKIVILSDKTTFNKNSAGAKSDLKTGEQVSAFGAQNADGSITAQVVGIGGNGGMFRMGIRDGQPQASPSSTPSGKY
jgi:hypothetical protein